MHISLINNVVFFFIIMKMFCQELLEVNYANLEDVHTSLMNSVVVLIIMKMLCTDKPILSSHLKIDKTKTLMTNGSFMNVKSIAECSPWIILQYFCLHYAIFGLENQFLVFFEWLLKTGFSVYITMYLCQIFVKI